MTIRSCSSKSKLPAAPQTRPTWIFARAHPYATSRTKLALTGCCTHGTTPTRSSSTITRQHNDELTMHSATAGSTIPSRNQDTTMDVAEDAATVPVPETPPCNLSILAYRLLCLRCCSYGCRGRRWCQCRSLSIHQAALLQWPHH